MTTFNDVLYRLKKENFRFSFDGDSTIEVFLGLLSVSAFFEFDDKNIDRPVAVQFSLVVGDNHYETLENEFYDEYDSETKQFNDLNLDTIISKLTEMIENSIPVNKALIRISKHVDDIVSEIEEHEIPENVVVEMITKKIDFY
jgi:poly-beta-hydroxyalkanoate depolymerase